MNATRSIDVWVPQNISLEWNAPHISNQTNAESMCCGLWETEQQSVLLFEPSWSFAAGDLVAFFQALLRETWRDIELLNYREKSKGFSVEVLTKFFDCYLQDYPLSSFDIFVMISSNFSKFGLKPIKKVRLKATRRNSFSTTLAPWWLPSLLFSGHGRATVTGTMFCRTILFRTGVFTSVHSLR